MNKLLDNLNDQQKEAVLATEGPVLVLAGAGSGKTKALTHRIAYLVREKKISPYNILAVTFTNKAAKEMTERISRLLGQPINYRLPWMGTFHSICVRILRREADFVGYSRSFSIYDDGDQSSIIKRIMKELNIDPKHFNPNSVQYFISGAKNELITAEEYKKYINSPFEKITSQVYERYECYLREANAMDFDDLIMQCVKLFQNNEKILEKHQELFKYILIDEYQDTNQAQYLWTKLLASRHKNIMVVGDDYQSIYSWRGANFRNILNFERDWRDAKVIKLEQNYRSTKTILEAANDVIKFNENKTDKKLWTNNSQGLPITVYEALNEKDEAEFTAMEIRSMVSRGKCGYSDCAILYRTNAQSRAVEETFLRFKIPYKVIGGVRFYDRKEIKDVLSYLRFIANQRDFEAFARLVTVPPRGIGEKTVEKIREFFNTKHAVNNEMIEELSQTFPSKVTDFFKLIKEFIDLSATKSLDQLIYAIATKSGIKEFLLDGSAEGEGRWENVEELMTVAEQVEANLKIEPENDGRSPLEVFLEQVALVQDVDQIDTGEGVVTLMTLHSAKGLEFQNVFIVGVEEGLFPHSRALMDASEMEEERRLCYVGITRAKERLYLIYAGERNIYGRFQCNEKSRFIENIPEHLIDQI
jgi:DNA helicase-2/ATP-dependent DNA helicase PcrA